MIVNCARRGRFTLLTVRLCQLGMVAEAIVVDHSRSVSQTQHVSNVHHSRLSNFMFCSRFGVFIFKPASLMITGGHVGC